MNTTFRLRVKSGIIIFGLFAVFLFLPKILRAATIYASPASGNYSEATVAPGALAVTVTSVINNSDVTVSWDRPVGAFGFSFELDQSPDTVPDNTLDTTVTTTKSYQGLKDGVWYFHIKARGQAASSAFGSTTHYKIEISSQAPASPTPVIVPGPAGVGFFESNVQIPLYLLAFLILLVLIQAACLVWYIAIGNNKKR